MWALVRIHMWYGINVLWVNLNSINFENATNKIIEVYDYSSREDLDTNLKVAPVRKIDKIRIV